MPGADAVGPHDRHCPVRSPRSQALPAPSPPPTHLHWEEGPESHQQFTATGTAGNRAPSHRSCGHAQPEGRGKAWESPSL